MACWSEKKYFALKWEKAHFSSEQRNQSVTGSCRSQSTLSKNHSSHIARRVTNRLHCNCSATIGSLWERSWDTFGLPRRVRPSWLNQATFSTSSCLFSMTLCGLSYPTLIKLLAVRRSPHDTLQIAAQTLCFTFETLVSNHSLVLCQSFHAATLSCFVQTWVLGHEPITFPALHSSFCLQASVCSCLTYGEHKSVTLSCAVGHWSVSLMGLFAFLKDAQALWWGKVTVCLPLHWWVGMDGRQLSFLIARTKQKINSISMIAGVSCFHALRDDVDQSLIPAPPRE